MSHRQRTTSWLTALLFATLFAVLFSAMKPSSVGAKSGDSGKAASTEESERTFALRAGTVYTVSGDVLNDVTILVEDGKIAQIGKDVAVKDGVRVYDLSDHVVLPGLIDAETTLASDGRDTRKSISPEVKAIDGWDFFRKLDDVLEGGVTTVYVSPGIAAQKTGRTSTRLVSGRGAVVKTAGRDKDRLARIVTDGIGIQVNLGDLALRHPTIFNPPVGASPDLPFEMARSQLPQSRIGEFLALRQFIGRAREYRTSVETSLVSAAPMPDFDPESASIFPLLEGRDHLRVRADKARDIYHILQLAREMGVSVVLEGAAEGERLTKWIAAMKVPVIFPGAFQPGRLPQGDLMTPVREGRLDEEAILRMQKAGVKIVLNSPSDADVKNLLLQAAAAVRLGMDSNAALRAITLNPAQVLGIDDRVGSIEVGKDADLIILGGDPFGPDNQPQAVIIEGEIVHRATPEISADTTVIRGGRILTGTGEVIRGGVVLVRKGKIEYVGAGALLGSIDKAAKVIDASGFTIVPGMIDAGGTAGLRAENLTPGYGARSGSSGAASSAALRLVDSIDPTDPSLDVLIRAGITTAIIMPPSGRDVSGQVSVLKLRAADPTKAVIEPYAALHFGGVSSRTLKSAKAYHDSWKKWEAKRDKAKSDKAKSDKAKSDEAKSDEAKSDEAKSDEAKSDKAKSDKAKSDKAKSDKAKGDEAKGDEAKGDEAKKKDSESKDDPPKKNDAYEPFRAVFDQKVPALIEVSSRGSLEAAVKLFKEQYKARVLVTGLASISKENDLAKVLEVVRSQTEGAILSTPFLVQQDRKTINWPQEFTSAGLSISLRSRVATGARLLPLQIAYAVREGWNSDQALRAMTLTAAKQFGVADRIGSIEKGKDADLVILSGEPFAVTTRVLGVVVDGRLVLGVDEFAKQVED
jgi:imidazolonepropionase-like amidohydrolase